jgi:hypothetical protein
MISPVLASFCSTKPSPISKSEGADVQCVTLASVMVAGKRKRYSYGLAFGGFWKETFSITVSL